MKIHDLSMLLLQTLVFILSLIGNAFAIGPFTLGGLGAITAGAAASYKYAYCLKYECCDDNWIKFNYEALQSNFTNLLFGQHIAHKVVLRSLSAHLKKEEPKKALVMSFHGWTGTGKNLVATLMAKNMFWEGPKSKFFKLYVGSKDFPLKEEVNKYRQKLRSDIESATKECERNLFVFDEVDKMAPGVLDAVSPYVDYHESMQGADYRKNVFLFLSNSGGSNITGLALKFWAEGIEREEIKLKDLDRMVSWNAFNEKGGLQRSEIVKKDLIDAFVPFLPLEKRHIDMCIESELRARGRASNKSLIKKISSQMVYEPPDTNLFSVSGCKKISHKVDLFEDESDS